MTDFSTFACSKCGTVDATTLDPDNTGLCTACRTGDWHGIWERESFDPAVHRGVNNRECDTDPQELDDASFS